jgi:AsmA protein
VTHLSLRDSVLSLDPLDFGIAGGRLDGVVTLDGQKDPIRAHARVKAQKILISKLFPTVELSKTSIGQINGELDLAGTGNSVRRMLASSSGTLGLVVAGGEISRLMMEKAGLHLWEILELQVTGDELVRLRCAVADFDVKEGVMDARALVFDTEITTLIGSGRIDLGEEKLDLTFNQQTKETSPVALRSPIHLRGSFARPVAGVDKGRAATRALGAIALGMVNPLLSLIALVDAGPGEDHDCAQLVRDAKAVSQAQKK